VHIARLDTNEKPGLKPFVECKYDCARILSTLTAERIMLDSEERILILVPTLFFVVTLAWGYLSERFTLDEIREVDHLHYDKITESLSPHIFQVMYSDAVSLFMVNGIIWILQLYQMAL
jgi:hypothetical protein